MESSALWLVRQHFLEILLKSFLSFSKFWFINFENWTKMKLFCSQTDKSGCHMTSLPEVIGDRQWLWGKCGFCWRTASQVCPQSLSNPKDIMLRRFTDVLLGRLQSGLLWRTRPWTDQQPWEAVLLEWQRPLSSKWFISEINSKIRKRKTNKSVGLELFSF